MSNKNLLDNIKKLREMTGVGFKDCKIALDETKGDLDKSVEFLRKKGIAKASKKMSRTAAEGLALVKEDKGEISLIEINSETDFVAKNQDFINFCKELSDINFSSKGKLDLINKSKMKNKSTVEENLVNLIAKIGEKITIRRANFFDNSNGSNFSYVHSAIDKGIGKIISVVEPLIFAFNSFELANVAVEIDCGECLISQAPPDSTSKASVLVHDNLTCELPTGSNSKPVGFSGIAVKPSVTTVVSVGLLLLSPRELIV